MSIYFYFNIRLNPAIDFSGDLVYYFVMATSTLIIYEPIDSFRDKSSYWLEYAKFYENYWGGPTSPLGVWFGNEYRAFQQALANHLGIDEQEIEDCFFMKDDQHKYYVAPVSSKANILSSENIIPLDWFMLFAEDERKALFTHWGLNAIHYDTAIKQAICRIFEAEAILGNYSDSEDLGIFTALHPGNVEHMKKGLSDLRAWLSGFDPSGFIVLNYGDICSIIHPYTLDNERSVSEIWGVLRLLEEGKAKEADSSLVILLQKWGEIRSKAEGNIDTSTIQ